MTLQSTSSGCVYVNGNPYQKGSLAVSYEGNNVTIWERDNSNNKLINQQPFGSVENGDESEPFQSLAELKAFVEENFFFELGEGSGGDPVIVESPYLSERFVIPADFNGTLSRAALADATVHTIKVWYGNGDGSGEYNPTNYPYNPAGTINLTALALQQNDVVIITGKKV